MGIMKGISTSCYQKPTILLKSETSTFNVNGSGSGRANAAISGRAGVSYEGTANGEKKNYYIL